MTESEAKAWVEARFGTSAAEQMASLWQLVAKEAHHQNLISPATMGTFWSRHLADSAQLLKYVPEKAQTWVDVGTGAGFPGLIVAMLFGGEVHLIEPRRKRADFLRQSAVALGLNNVNVHQSRAEGTRLPPLDVITARAVGTPERLFEQTRDLRHTSSRYILPRGRGGNLELDRVRSSYDGVFHVEHSLTDAESIIIVVDGVTRRCSVSP